MRRLLLAMGMCAAVTASASTACWALEEQRAPAAVAAPSPEAPKADVQSQGEASKSDSGTEIRIPGLGKLGTLPKMDFGLELLYGAAEGKPVQDTEPQDHDQQDLMIHGTVKHRF